MADRDIQCPTMSARWHMAIYVAYGDLCGMRAFFMFGNVMPNAVSAQ